MKQDVAKETQHQRFTLIFTLLIIVAVVTLYLFPDLSFYKLLWADPRQSYVDSDYCITECTRDDVYRAFAVGVSAGIVSNLKIALFNNFIPLMAFFLFSLLPGRNQILDIKFAFSMLALWIIFDLFDFVANIPI